MIIPSAPYPYTPSDYARVWGLWHDLIYTHGVDVRHSPYTHSGYRHVDDDDLAHAMMTNGGMRGDGTDTITLSVAAYGPYLGNGGTAGNTDYARANVHYLEETYDDYLQIECGPHRTVSVVITLGALHEDDGSGDEINRLETLVRELQSLENEPVLCDEMLERVRREICEEEWTKHVEDRVREDLAHVLEREDVSIPDGLTLRGLAVDDYGEYAEYLIERVEDGVIFELYYEDSESLEYTCDDVIHYAHNDAVEKIAHRVIPESTDLVSR